MGTFHVVLLWVFWHEFLFILLLIKWHSYLSLSKLSRYTLALLKETNKSARSWILSEAVTRTCSATLLKKTLGHSMELKYEQE